MNFLFITLISFYGKLLYNLCDYNKKRNTLIYLIANIPLCFIKLDYISSIIRVKLIMFTIDMALMPYILSVISDNLLKLEYIYSYPKITYMLEYMKQDFAWNLMWTSKLLFIIPYFYLL